MRNYTRLLNEATCFGYLLESPHSEAILTNIQNIYSVRTKQGLSYRAFCPYRILYNSKVILMATSLGTNAIVVTRVHCII